MQNKSFVGGKPFVKRFAFGVTVSVCRLQEPSGSAARAKLAVYRVVGAKPIVFVKTCYIVKTANKVRWQG